jgi:hypothetical protein
MRWASSIATEAKRPREKVAAPPAAGVYEMGVAPVSFPDGEPEPPFIGRDDNQADVIGRQTVGPDLDASFPSLFGQEGAIDVLVAVFEESRLSSIAAPRHMMRATGNDDAGETGHARAVSWQEHKGSMRGRGIMSLSMTRLRRTGRGPPHARAWRRISLRRRPPAHRPRAMRPAGRGAPPFLS